MDCIVKTELGLQLDQVRLEIILLDEIFSRSFNRDDNADEVFMSAWNKVKSAKQVLLGITLEESID